MPDNQFYGWFDDATQTKPTYEPPRDAPCLLCGCKVTADDVRTINLMPTTGYAKRSYFYRSHRTCAEKHGMDATDGLILDMIERNGD